MRLIGLHGRLHSGKDTTFEFIDNYALDHDLMALRRAFADPLKISGMRALGFEGSNEDLVITANEIKESGHVTVTWEEDNKLVANSITGRKLWQLYGTEAHRADDLGASFGTDFWVDNLLPLNGAETTARKPLFWYNFKEEPFGYADIAVVTDVRFENEAQRILDLGGEVWWIDANERLGPNEDAHASEQPLPDELVTVKIDNNGTLADFDRNVLTALERDEDEIDY